MKVKQVVIVLMVIGVMIALDLENKANERSKGQQTLKGKSGQKDKQRSRGRSGLNTRSKTNSRNKSKHQQKSRHTDRNKAKHRTRYNKIMKKYMFNEKGEADTTPADGAAAPETTTPADDGATAGAGAGADATADAGAAKSDNKQVSALKSMQVSLTPQMIKQLQQKQKLDDGENLRKTIRDFKRLTEPSKIFTEGPLDLDKPHLTLENSDSIPDDYDKMDSTKECEYKEGHLAYITNMRLPNMIVKPGQGTQVKYPVMNGLAVLAVLNKDSLSLFDKEHVNSLIRTYDIKHLQPYVNPTYFGELQCFQLISNTNAQKVMLTRDPDSPYIDPSQVMATLCASNYDRMMNWKDAIERFSNCKVEVAQDETVKVENTFDTVKSRVRVLKEKIKQDEKVNQEYSKTNNDQELIMVQKYVDNMKRAVADEVNKQNQQKRELTVKLENDIKKSVGTSLQEECLEKALQIQQDEESRAVENMIQSESETREEEELKKQQDDLIKQLKEKGKNIALQETSLDETIQKMTKQMQYNMVQSVQEFQRSLSPDMCNFNKADFPPGVASKEDRMNYVCTQLIDPQAVDIETVNDCMVPEYFCDVCCNYNIGPADEVGREKCDKACSSNFKDADSNKFELIYVLEANPERLKNFMASQTSNNAYQSALNFLKSMINDGNYVSIWKDSNKGPKEKLKVKSLFKLTDEQFKQADEKKGW